MVQAWAHEGAVVACHSHGKKAHGDSSGFHWEEEEESK